MQVLIVDNDDAVRAKKLAAELLMIGINVVISYRGTVYATSVGGNQSIAIEESNAPDDVAIAFVHERNLLAFKDLGLVDVGAISYSGGGAAEIPRPVDGGFTSSEVRHIQKQLLNGEPRETLKDRILKYWRSAPEKLALRLLCEAWLANDGLSDKEHGDARVVVHAPTELMQWLAPFRDLVEQRDASDVAALFGDAEVEAAEVFRCVNQGGDCREAVSALVRKLSDGTKVA